MIINRSFIFTHNKFPRRKYSDSLFTFYDNHDSDID